MTNESLIRDIQALLAAADPQETHRSLFDEKSTRETLLATPGYVRQTTPRPLFDAALDLAAARALQADGQTMLAKNSLERTVSALTVYLASKDIDAAAILLPREEG